MVKPKVVSEDEYSIMVRSNPRLPYNRGQKKLVKFLLMNDHLM